jgi:TonB family protein
MIGLSRAESKSGRAGRRKSNMPHYRNKFILAGILLCLGPASAFSGNSGKYSLVSTGQQFAQAGSSLEADRLNARVVELFNQGKFEESLPLARQALMLRESEAQSNPRQLRTARINLAAVLIKLNKLNEATSIYERLLKESEAANGKASLDNAELLDKLAWLKFMQADHLRAKELFRRALKIREAALGANDIQVASTAFQIAETYRLTDDFKTAEPFYLRAIEIKKALLPSDKESTKNMVDRYSCLLYATKRQSSIEEFRKKVFPAEEQPDTSGPTGDVMNGKAIYLAKPEYPPNARYAGVGGLALLKVSIDEKGNVTEATEVCGALPSFAEAAKKAAFKSRFTPTTLGGQPVKVTGMISYNFQFN